MTMYVRIPIRGKVCITSVANSSHHITIYYNNTTTTGYPNGTLLKFYLTTYGSRSYDSHHMLLKVLLFTIIATFVSNIQTTHHMLVDTTVGFQCFQ